MMKRIRRFFLLLIWVVPIGGYAMTTAGTVINNTVVVSYEIGGTTLSISRSLSFVVDYYADLLVANSNGGDTSVVPGQSQAGIFFELKNEGNKEETFTFTVDETVSGDNFDPVPLSCKVYDSANVDITAGVTVGQESSMTVEVRCDIPSGLSANDVGTIVLIADNGLTNASAPDDPDAEQIVLADDAGVEDSMYDGKHSASGNYRVNPYTLNIKKLSCVFSDPDVGQSPNAQVKSGSVMVYVFDIYNPTTLSFSDLRVEDTLSSLLDAASVANITLESQVAQECTCVTGQGNTVTGVTSNPPDTGSGTTVSVPVGGILPSERKCLSFHVNIN